MNVIVVSIILLLRVVVPLGILLAIGEWVRRREENYWLKM
jgi:hypothetical protein